jgi:predicted amidohydrolase YtcJ
MWPPRWWTRSCEGNAYANHQEAELGALTPGRRADLIICSDDVFTCPEERIKDIVPLATMLGGELVYRRDAPS